MYIEWPKLFQNALDAGYKSITVRGVNGRPLYTGGDIETFLEFLRDNKEAFGITDFTNADLHDVTCVSISYPGRVENEEFWAKRGFYPILLASVCI